jgi:hypothetical protein
LDILVPNLDQGKVLGSGPITRMNMGPIATDFHTQGRELPHTHIGTIQRALGKSKARGVARTLSTSTALDAKELNEAKKKPELNVGFPWNWQDWQ